MKSHRLVHALAMRIIMILGIFTVLSAAEEQALFFDGKDDYVQCPFIAFDKMAAFTIEVWVRNWSGYIINQGASGDPENGIWLSTDEGLTDGCAWEVDKGKNYAVNIGTLPVDRWMHIAMQYDGKEQSVFLNGKLIKKQAAPKPGPFDETRDFIIGGVEMGRPEYYWYFGSGYLRSFRISTAVRYTADFAPDADLKTDGKTVQLFNAGSLQKSRLVDLSKNRLNGSVRGARMLAIDAIKPNTLSGIVQDAQNNKVTDALVYLKEGETYGAGTGLETRTNTLGEYSFLLNSAAPCYLVYAYKDSAIHYFPHFHLNESGVTKLDFKILPANFSHFRWAGRLVGAWLSRQTGADKKEYNVRMSFRWTSNCNAMAYDWQLTLDGQELGTENGLIGWDPLKKQLVDWHWDQSGNRCQGVVEITSEKIVRKFDLLTPAGKLFKLSNQLWLQEVNTLFLQDSRIDADGQMQPSGEALVFKRIVN